MAVTFKVDDVELASELIPEKPVEEIARMLFGQHIESYEIPHSSLIGTKSNAFVVAVHHAYNEHRPLLLSPDHIWLIICQGFAQHVKLYAELLSHKFVAHEGKRELIALHPALKHGAKNPWQEIIPQFSQQIRQQIGAELHDMLVPRFSTTGSCETLAYEICLMESMSPYFDYHSTLCGIPSISLEGTVEDWQHIQSQVQKLRDYELGWWVDALETILPEFVLAAQGQPNQSFWQNFYKLKNASGGPYISGWILKFFPYMANSGERNPYLDKEPDPTTLRQGLTLAEFPNGISSAIVHCKLPEEEWDVRLNAGFLGISQNHQTFALRPEIAWVVRDEKPYEENRQAVRLMKRSLQKLENREQFEIPHGVNVEFIKGVYLIESWDSQRKRWENGNFDNLPNNLEYVESRGLRYAYVPDDIKTEQAMYIIKLHEQQLVGFEDAQYHSEN